MISVNFNTTNLPVTAEDPRLAMAIADLNLATRASSIKMQLDPELIPAHLVGEWGLTGLCLGYGIECVNWVTQHENETTIPPLIESWPKESIRHLSKLIILALYQSVEKGVDPQTVVWSAKNRELIIKILDAYQALLFDQTGIKIIGKSPGPSIFEITAMPVLADELSVDEEHTLFIMGGSDTQILARHVIYANPKLGIIGDAATGLLWKITPTSKHLFPEVFKYFINKNYKYENAVKLNLKQEAAPTSRPLLISRIFRRAQTAFAIAKHSSLIMGIKYLYVINQNNKLFERFRSDDLDKLKWTLAYLSQNTIYPNFVLFVENNLQEIGLLDEPSLSDFGFLNDLSEDLNFPEKADELLNIAQQLHRLGPKTKLLLVKIINKILRKLPNPPYPEHILKTFVPGLLALKVLSRQDLSSRMDYTMPSAKHIPFYRLLIKAGANLNGSMDAYANGNSPLDRFLNSEDTPDGEVIQFFLEKGAKSIFTPTFKKLKVLLKDGRFSELLTLIEENLDEIEAFTSRAYSFMTPPPILEQFYEDLEDSERSASLLINLEKIRQLGPKADNLLSLVLSMILLSIPRSLRRLSVYPDYIVNEFIPAILKLRGLLPSRFQRNLDRIMGGSIDENDTPKVKDFPFYKLLIEAGASGQEMLKKTIEMKEDSSRNFIESDQVLTFFKSLGVKA